AVETQFVEPTIYVQHHHSHDQIQKKSCPYIVLLNNELIQVHSQHVTDILLSTMLLAYFLNLVQLVHMLLNRLKEKCYLVVNQLDKYPLLNDHICELLR